MAKYQYEALDKKGKMVSGIMHAVDEDDLYRRLKEEEKYLVNINDDSEEQTTRQLSAKMLSEFNRELGDMLHAGVTLVRALTILSQEETRNKRERKILSKVLKRIRQGESMADAMEQQQGAFPALMLHMYRAAETSGNLSDTAMRLAVHYEKEHQLNTKIRGATIYPRILCVLIVLVMIFVLGFILPQLSGLFDALEELPVPTRILFAIGNFVTGYWKWLLALAVILGVVFLAFAQMKSVQLLFAKWKVKMPVTGKLMMVVYTARFSRSLSSLYRAGIPIIAAMQIARKTIGNEYIENQFEQVIADLRAGKPLSESIERVDGFRKKLSAVIRVGEESGDLVQMLDSLSDSFDYESEMAVARLLAYLEPALIVFMAFVIGFIMIAVMLPIYESYSAIGGSTAYF